MLCLLAHTRLAARQLYTLDYILSLYPTCTPKRRLQSFKTLQLSILNLDHLASFNGKTPKPYIS